MKQLRGLERDSATRDSPFDAFEEHAPRRHHRDARVAVLAVVPLEESLTEGACIDDRCGDLSRAGFRARVRGRDREPRVSRRHARADLVARRHGATSAGFRHERAH